MAKRKQAPPKRRRAARRSREGEGAPPSGGEREGGLSSLLFPLLCAALAVAVAVLVSGRMGGRASADARRGQEIVVGGARVSIGTPVVLWTDPGGYNAYAQRCFFDPEQILPTAPTPGTDTPERIGKRTSKAPLRESITQFVLHYDMAFNSRGCFRTLQDRRGLSVHFLCDMDGTIYQTCDVAERCRHAREANDRSVGVEIAHPGALEGTKGLSERYKRDALGPYLDLPASLGKSPFRTAGYIPRPARKEPIRGAIHGRAQTMWDYTEEQYKALAHLAAGLSRALPRIRLDAPRDESGNVLVRTFTDSAHSLAFEGIIGHHHLTTDKFDPGPALDWERLLGDAQRIRAGGQE